MASAPQRKIVNPFDRRTRRYGDISLMVSTCLICGFKIIGCDTDGLPEEEQRHLERDHPETQKY